MILETLTIQRRFCGPSRSGNGGYTCGRIAAHIPGAAAVRLLLPPPLDTRLTLERDGEAVVLLDGEQQVGEGRAVRLTLDPPAAPSFATAEVASQRYLGYEEHSFPHCFVCGPQREPGDGLNIFAGPTGVSGVVASTWVPDAGLERGGQVADEFIWAALDCPSAFAVLPVPPEKALVLGQLSARIDGSLLAGERCVVIGWSLGIDGRKRRAGSALFGADGGLVAVAEAVWIEVPASLFPPEGVANGRSDA